tara:strand:+ start:251 stop:538 length:288 start_codon:yes stop_codon:yes gene_type:complete
MSEKEIALNEITTSLKSGFSDEFSSMKGVINNLADKMDLSDKEKDGMSTVSDFVEHLESCDNDNCEIHKSINTKTNNYYMKGFLLGAKFGKQKRN